jgi:hypothetical protein
MVSFESKIEAMSVDGLINKIESMTNTGRINLNPAYQRGSVWDMSTQSGFIDSLILNIIPNNIIFNKIDGSWNCIDGKQRLTSIIDYKMNKFNIEINDEKVYYDKCNSTNSRVMTNAEMYDKFNDRSLPIVTYTNLSYADESEIFNRIQKGKVLTLGEKVFPLCFTDEKVIEQLKTSLDTNSSIFEKYNYDVNRYDYLSDFFQMYRRYAKKDYGTILVQDKLHTYIRESLDNTKFIKKLSKFWAKLKFVLDDNMLGHKDINRKHLYKNVIIALVYLFNDTRFDNKNNKELRKLCSAVIHETKIKKMNGKTQDNFTDINIIFEKECKKLKL